MSLDATKPEDVSYVNLFAGFVRETRAKVNELEATIIAYLTGAPVYTPVTVTETTHEVLSNETFIKANAVYNGIILQINPEDLATGITYVIKKTDASANVVTLLMASGTFVNDTLSSLEINLQYEVVSFVSDGTGIQTC